MAVDANISRAYVEAELQNVSDMAESCGWRIILPATGLRFAVVMTACNGDLFIIDFECSDYREQPALVEFVDPATGIEGTKHAYPRTTNSLFHDNGPCICAPFNRKAYKSIHTSWKFGDWTTSKENNYDWSSISTLGDILGLIYTRLSRTEFYKGRMA